MQAPTVRPLLLGGFLLSPPPGVGSGDPANHRRTGSSERKGPTTERPVNSAHRPACGCGHLLRPGTCPAVAGGFRAHTAGSSHPTCPRQSCWAAGCPLLPACVAQPNRWLTAGPLRSLFRCLALESQPSLPQVNPLSRLPAAVTKPGTQPAICSALCGSWSPVG